mmetsp:Transcript_68998/g.206945  ORF Transcript_68998/g.206945 Transcript_68998/m.206945 type:complete len:285 (-) Transcript_68998:146-1000(-)
MGKVVVECCQEIRVDVDAREDVEPLRLESDAPPAAAAAQIEDRRSALPRAHLPHPRTRRRRGAGARAETVGIARGRDDRGGDGGVGVEAGIVGEAGVGDGEAGVEDGGVGDGVPRRRQQHRVLVRVHHSANKGAVIVGGAYASAGGSRAGGSRAGRAYTRAGGDGVCVCVCVCLCVCVCGSAHRDGPRSAHPPVHSLWDVVHRSSGWIMKAEGEAARRPRGARAPWLVPGLAWPTVFACRATGKATLHVSMFVLTACECAPGAALPHTTGVMCRCGESRTMERL